MEAALPRQSRQDPARRPRPDRCFRQVPMDLWIGAFGRRGPYHPRGSGGSSLPRLQVPTRSDSEGSRGAVCAAGSSLARMLSRPTRPHPRPV